MPDQPQSPQEKKAHSYAKDRRNSYGANDKAARTAIPARKAGENRRNRRKVKQGVLGIPGLAEGEAVVAESSVRQDVFRVGGWTKTPDVPLATFVEEQQRRRIAREGRKSWREMAQRLAATDVGTISIETTSGQGTTVRLSLPYAGDAELG